MRTLAFGLILMPLLAACGGPEHPAPGQAPGWDTPSPPRPSYAPLPFTTNYAPLSGQVQPSPPATADGTIPYAVRGQPVQQTQAQKPPPSSQTAPPVLSQPDGQAIQTATPTE